MEGDQSCGLPPYQNPLGFGVSASLILMSGTKRKREREGADGFCRGWVCFYCQLESL